MVTFPLDAMVKWAMHMCHVMWPITWGGQKDPHFWNPWPQFIYSLCHFKGTTTRILLCYR